MRSLLKFLMAAALLVHGLDGYAQDKNSKEADTNNVIDKDAAPAPLKPKAPVVVSPLNVSSSIVQQSIVNGVRTIVATGNGEKVEITDTNGKNIVLKHTRKVAGKDETTQYQAEDIAALKAKSPEAAALYEKYGSRKETPLPAPLRFQVPIQVRPPAPQSLLNDDSQHVAGPRRIRVELVDRKIEIYDGTDDSILLKVIKTVDGRDQAEEFTADNLRRFKELHPEAYLLYKKYTGLKATNEN